MSKSTIRGRTLARGKSISLGVDVHKKSWHITAICEGIGLFNGSIPPDYEAFKSLLQRFPDCKITVAYEAGAFGFGLYDCLENEHIRCLVVAPSRIPSESGNRVKTDRHDSLKLAHLLEAGLLKEIFVLSIEQRMDRELLRTRRQVVEHRAALMRQIKSKLLFHSLRPECKEGRTWTIKFVRSILNLDFPHSALKKVIETLLTVYEQLGETILSLGREVRALAKTEKYRDKVSLLCTIPGVGILTAMEILTELGDLERFPSNEQLSSFLGLTPSEFSSGEHTRRGRITRCGNKRVRACLVESSWKLICRDEAMRQKYEAIKYRRGGKRAIVGIARKLAGRIRGVILRNERYVTGVA